MLVKNVTVEPFGISDHFVIKWDTVITKLEIITVTELSFIILMWVMNS